MSPGGRRRHAKLTNRPLQTLVKAVLDSLVRMKRKRRARKAKRESLTSAYIRITTLAAMDLRKVWVMMEMNVLKKQRARSPRRESLISAYIRTTIQAAMDL